MCNQPTTRLIHFELLRIIACFGVIFIHLAASLVDKNRIVTCFDAMNFWNSLGRASVPIFVMITGALLLTPEKDISLKDIFKKYIFRIIYIFICWSLFYVFVHWVVRERTFTLEIINNMFFKFCKGNYHLWYLHMRLIEKVNATF